MFELRSVLALLLAVAVSAGALSFEANAAVLVNPGFGGPEVLILGDTTRNPITNDAAGQWILGGNDDGDRWEIDGTGAAAVASSDPSGGEAQGMVQWLQDNQATTGAGTLDFGYRMQSPTGSGDYDLHLYVFGWNAGDNAPGVDYENGTAETGDSFIPDDSVNLITDATGTEGRLVLANNGAAAFPGVVNDGIFNPISVNVDFGAGHDFLGVLFYGENSGGILQLDNIQFSQAQAVIPEPSTLLIWTLLASLGIAAARRRPK